MTETKETTENKPTLTRKPLSLKRTVESGHVRQSFSHGRSKSVVVEKKKTRKITAPGEVVEEALPAAAAPEPEPALPQTIAQRPGALSTGELDARRRALHAEKEAERERELERQRLKALEPPPELAPQQPEAAAEAPAETQALAEGVRADGAAVTEADATKLQRAPE